MRHHRAAGQIGRDEIDLDDAPPDIGLELPQRRIAAGDAGIVDEDVDLAGVADKRVDGLADRRLVGDVDDRGVDTAAPLSAAAALSSAAASTSHNTTAAPEASIFCAAAKPMPRAPPVMMAVRPLRSMVFMSAAHIRSFPRKRATQSFQCCIEILRLDSPLARK